MSCNNESTASKINVAILTISDRCFNGEAEDKSGPEIKQLVETGKLFNGEVVEQNCCPDEKEQIQGIISQWCDRLEIDLIISSGGTGIAPRDVTPEAVKQILEKEVIGITQQIITESLKVTPMAMISRPICGVRRKSLIICLPGSRKACKECLGFISAAIPHAIQLIKDKKDDVEKIHAVIQGRSPVKDSKFDVPFAAQSCVDTTRVASRPRFSQFPMISVADALHKVLGLGLILPSEQIQTSNSLGLCLAKDTIAEASLPPFPASIKDGYAVLASDGLRPRKVVGQSCAGMEPPTSSFCLQSGTCCRINTGAPLPLGADAVVQVEDTNINQTTEDGKEELEINILKEPSKGQDIRPIGCDIKEGKLLFRQGTIIGPSELGVLASAGVMNVTVHMKPLVGLLSTGNEMQEAFTEPREPGSIYDSNKVVLTALMQEHKIPYFDAGIAPDCPNELLSKIRKALFKADILVTTGGVSMGDKDLLKSILVQDLGATIHFAQTFMKPGKPTTFASLAMEGKVKLILALPGNPTSALVTAHLYLLPLCRKMSGNPNYMKTVIRAKLGSSFKLDIRPEYHRATLSWSSSDDLPTAHSTGNQLSSRLLSMCSAQALLQLPPGVETKELSEGTVVNAILLN